MAAFPATRSAKQEVPMRVGDLVYVHCQLSRGGFSSERVFRLHPGTDNEFVGSSPVQYCRTADEQPLKPDQPAKGHPIQGRVAARVIREGDAGDVWVSFPDGSVAQVPEKGLVVPQEAKESPNVPLKS